MISIGKKILSAFVEMDEKKEPVAPPEGRVQPNDHVPPKDHVPPNDHVQPQDRADERFAGHFDKLLSEANIPGPDYYEFARMIAVMQAIPDEAARYNAAFAGLQVQGLNRERLLDTADGYLRIMTTDAEQFQATVDASYREKVHGPEAEAEEKTGRIRALSQEIVQLQQQISALQEEVRSSKERLAAGSGGYTAESNRRQQEIRR
ncbi:MAG TPA: hypothetical protein VKR41_06345, partial [Puia sp.]|nr:hypothetical protein [Puia sp.]